MIALEQRRGKGENDSTLLRRARGRFVLLLNEDAELRAGRDDGAARGADLAARRRRSPARCSCARDGAPAAVGMALPGAADGAAGAPVPAPALRRAEPRDEHARGRLGAVGGAARAPRRRRGGRLHRPRVLRLLRRGRLLQAAARRGLGGALRPVGARRRATSAPADAERRGSSSSRATATATCASTTPLGRPQRALADRLHVRDAGARGARAARPRRAPLRAPRRRATLFPGRGEGLAESAAEYNRGGRRL